MIHGLKLKKSIFAVYMCHEQTYSASQKYLLKLFWKIHYCRICVVKNVVDCCPNTFVLIIIIIIIIIIYYLFAIKHT